LQIPSTLAQKVEKIHSKRPALLYENKGQVVDQNRKVRNDVRMIFSANGFTLAIKDQGMSYELVSSKTYQKQKKDEMFEMDSIPLRRTETKHINDSVVFESHRIDIDFMNGNPHPIIIKEGRSDYYENYYTEYTGEQGVTNIYGYTKTILKDVWHNIDIEFIANGKTTNSIKYNFIIRAGGNINDIQLKYNGTMPVLLDNTIKITSTLGELTETIPAVYYTNTTAEKPMVNYVLKGGIVSFSGKNINTEHNTLVVDPSLVWGTYYGGSGDNDYALNLTINDSGFAYITGNTFCTTGISSSNAFQILNAGKIDVFIAKFSSGGKFMWATYYGGKSNEYSYGIDIGDSNNIYVTGYTISDSGIATSGSYQFSRRGKEEVFLAKFSDTGNLIWATYYGGENYDYSQAVLSDDSGYTYIVGYTYSDSNIATTGAFKSSYGGNIDAFIAKFSKNGVLIWATYYGSDNPDFNVDIATDDSNYLYITGYTSSKTNITTSNVYQTSIAGKYDAYITKFSNTGNRIWGTYFGGSENEYSSGITIDDSNYIYITGYTESGSGITTLGSHQKSIAGGTDVFIAKFSNTGNRKWSSYYGGKSDDVAGHIAADDSNNIFITGNTKSTSGIATYGANQTYFAGYYDAFVSKFSGAAKLKWATYYGGTALDNGTGISKGDSGSIYITGNTFSYSGIATSGAYQTIGSSNNDAFLAKFPYAPRNNAGPTALIYPVNSFCPGNRTVKITLKNFGIDTLKSDSIYWSVDGVMQKGILWKGKIKKDSSVSVLIGSYFFSKPGSIQIVVWSVKPNAVQDEITSNDTIKTIIIVYSLPTAFSGVDTAICIGNYITIGLLKTSGILYNWTSSPTGYYSTVSNPLVLPSSATNYYLKATDSITGCTNYDTVTINTNPANSSAINTFICQGNTYIFGGKNISNTGTYYDTLKNYLGCDSVVLLNLSVLSNNSSSIHAAICQGNTYYFGGINISSTGIYYDTLKNYLGCDSVIALNLSISQLPVPTVSGNPTHFCEGDSAILSIGKFKSYLWNTRDTTQSIIVKTSGNYYVKVKDSNSCGDSSNSINITVFANPAPVITKVSNSLQTGNYYTYQWYLNNGIINNATSQNYTPLTDGDYTVFVTDSNACNGTSVLYTVGWTGISAINDAEINIFPNPTNGDVIMEFNSTSNKIITIYDAFGKQILNTKFSDKTYKVSLDENYATGIYFFVVIEGGRNNIYKVVKELR